MSKMACAALFVGVVVALVGDLVNLGVLSFFFCGHFEKETAWTVALGTAFWIFVYFVLFCFFSMTYPLQFC